MKKRTLFAFALGLSGCGVRPPPTPGDGPLQTVIVLIGCTLRADRMPAYGNPRDLMPYLDGLVDDGVLFERMIATAPWTRPAVGSLTTGRYPLVLGIDHPRQSVRSSRGLHPDFTTLAEVFSGAGWSTVGATANPNANAHFNLTQGFDSYFEATGLWRDDRRKFPGEYVVEEWLKLAAEVDGPLYGQLLVVDTHSPLGLGVGDYAWMLAHGMVPPATVDEYDAALRNLDATIEALDEGLAALGRDQRLFVLVGDHGEGLNFPERAGHAHGRMLYDANVQVPWVLHGPGVARGHRVVGLAESVDVWPTVLDLAGVAPTNPVDGTSMAEQVRGAADHTPKEAAYSETFYGGTHKARWTTPEWTFIYTDPNRRHADGEVELYRARDRMADVDVSTKHLGQVNTYTMAIERLRTQLLAEQKTWEAPEPDAETEAQLRELGYLE